MIKIGIVGMGLRGKLFADTIGQNRYAELAAVSDLNEQSLKHSVDCYQVKGYTDVEQMIREADLDALVVATPDFLHKQPVMLAAARGLHILVEKPFSTSVEEAQGMYDAVQNAGVKCLVAFENRWSAPFIAVSEAVRRGEIGSILTMNSRLNDTIFVPTKMLKWSKGSSPGWFLLAHSTDMACYLKAGVRPVRVYAVGTKQKLLSMGIDTYDSIQTVVTFADGTNATFTTSWILPESMPLIVDFKYEIIGEDGAFYIDLHDQMVHQAGQAFKHVPTLGTPVNGMLLGPPSHMLNAFIDNIRMDTEPLAGPEDGLLNTKLVHAIHRSIELGTPLDL
ncbi:Gfo/Idh/MocA family protein [Paenibacillus sp. J2TS4]|uniref:Gfo/Idh/MocA family protein n=1 Tax=Paenibacillus sp. J2TS4 TaxID=2807194 RepID=UPI001B1C4A67|nr:Gfo/Idh/MocA family oxidoreductase [Paenibacillus sp. J2TS4]GIP32242.1 dehydrogenase [Paenibacillus sp. J2TS4]